MLSIETNGRGPTVIFFLHWLSGSSASWHEVAGRLASHFRCIAIDLPGFGKSIGLEGYTVGEMAASVAEIIRDENPESWMLVGHSMGAKVAAVVARGAEDGQVGLEGLKSMVLLAGSPPGPEPMEEDQREEMKSWFAGSEEMSRAQAKKFIAGNREQELPDGVEQGAVEDVLRMKRSAWLAWLDGGSREDWSPRVGVLHTPTLIVAGEEDPELGEAGQRSFMLPHFANARLKILPKAKHLLPMEFPEIVAGSIEEASTFKTPRESPEPPLLPADYLRLIESERVSPQTRSVLLNRGQPDSAAYEPMALRVEELAVLRAVADRVLPHQEGSAQEPHLIDLAHRVDRQLAAGDGNGWRYDLLPPDAEAYRAGIRTLDAEAKRVHQSAFCGLTENDQNALLDKTAKGKLGAGFFRHMESTPRIEDNPTEFHPLNGEQMQRWFEEVRGDLVRAYVAHPATLARMGYSGIADGSDAETMSGYVLIGIGQRESWEPVEHPGGVS